MKQVYAKVCVVGLGPAGLGATLHLARSPLASSTICLEAGVAADQKFCTILQGKGCRYVQPCQVITGLGGASVLSGGKISGFPAGRALTNIIGSQSETINSLQTALHLFHEFVPLISPQFSRETIEQAFAQYQQKGFEFRYYNAHLYRQADLVTGYTRMLNEISNAGVSVHLGTKVTNVTTTEQGFHVFCSSENTESEFFCDYLVLATGRSGTELLNSISSTNNLGNQPNQCDVGVRLEFPTSLWPNIDQCHNDLKLHFGNARTFCVCKDGFIAPYRFEDIFLLEGSSDPFTSTGLTNLAITVRLSSEIGIDHQILLSEVRQRYLAQTEGKPIRQRLMDFLENRNARSRENRQVTKPASISYWRWGNANACYPEEISDAIRKAVKFFVSRVFSEENYPEIFVFAPELDYYWSRFPLSQGFQSRKSGLYLIGDCTGHFRGILQAFCSGLRCVEHLLGEKYV